MDVTNLMIIYKNSSNRVKKKIILKLVKNKGCHIGYNISLGDNVRFVHDAVGTVVDTNTSIENNVDIYHNVTLGKSNVKSSEPIRIVIKSGAIICAGAKVLCKANSSLIIGENAVIAANAVVTNSVPNNETWGGIPARKIK